MKPGAPDDNDAAELARLDEKIAENDAVDTPDAAWRAAHAVWDKAELVERREGPEAALPLYADVVRRLHGRVEPGPRARLIYALHAVAHIHYLQGRQDESRRLAEALVDEHFDDAPLDAAGVVADATVLLSWLLRQAGEHDRALELVGRLCERYGKPGIPEYRRTTAWANHEIAWILAETGRADDALRRLESNIEDLRDTSDPDLRRILVYAYVRKAMLLSDKDLLADGDAVCEEIVEHFAGFQDPEIAENVAWARDFLAHRAGVVLHGYFGRGDEVEAACRRAVDAGSERTSFELGVALSMIRNREVEEEDAFRRAIEANDPKRAADAAVWLGSLLLYWRDDPAHAYEAFSLAANSPDWRASMRGYKGQARAGAAQGERAAAVAALAEAGRLSASRVDPEIAAEVATRMAQRTARLWLSPRYRRFLRARWHLHRRRRQVLASARVLRPLGVWAERRAARKAR